MDIRQKWFPEPHQLFIRSGFFKSRNYLKSLTAGFTIAILGIPVLFWRMVLFPLIMGLLGFIATTLMTLIFALLGKLETLDVDKEGGRAIMTVMMARIKTRRQLEEELEKAGAFK